MPLIGLKSRKMRHSLAEIQKISFKHQDENRHEGLTFWKVRVASSAGVKEKKR